MAKITLVKGQQGGKPVARATAEGRTTSVVLELMALPKDVRIALQKQVTVMCFGEVDDPSGFQLKKSASAPGGHAPQGGAQAQQAQAQAEEFTIVSVQPDGNGFIAEFDKPFEHNPPRPPKRRESLANLGMSDQIMGGRVGSRFTRPNGRWRLSGYVPKVAAGLSSATPSLNDNPYNFVPWRQPPAPADKPLLAHHDRDQVDRKSGVIRLTYTARAPIFIPESLRGQEPTASQVREFFNCVDAHGQQHYAIPGASVKGPVRSVFEALTNSRMGVTDTKALEWPPLYRRRAFRLFQITNDRPWQAFECAYEMLDSAGGDAEKLPAQNRLRIDPSLPSPVIVAYHANLYWVAPDRHVHKKGSYGSKTQLRLQRTSGPLFTIDSTVVKQFFDMEPHPHMERHQEQIANRSKSRGLWKQISYRNPDEPDDQKEAHYLAPEYASVRRRLFELRVGDLVFAIPTPGKSEIACFGRNVNFLWPGAKSPLAMIQASGFDARTESQSRLDNADLAEATFGFAGKNDYPRSHPFQGRVRFTTFWGPPVAGTETLGLNLMPLTSPAGSKAKSRPLYLSPGTGGKAADCDHSATLRGRKFYWHQKAENDKLALQHDADVLPVDGGPRPPSNVSQNETLRALPASTEFNGEVHFDNLTDTELGALLVSLAPHLAFQDAGLTAAPEADVNFGIKVGKGKPRGLGSLVATKITLIVQRPSSSRYAAFSEWAADEWGASETPKTFVDAFWKPAQRAGGSSKALERMLKIPRNLSVRVYPPSFHLYGWLPHHNNAAGAPQGDRPDALKLAENLPVE